MYDVYVVYSMYACYTGPVILMGFNRSKVNGVTLFELFSTYFYLTMQIYCLKASIKTKLLHFQFKLAMSSEPHQRCFSIVFIFSIITVLL